MSNFTINGQKIVIGIGTTFFPEQSTGFSARTEDWEFRTPCKFETEEEAVEALKQMIQLDAVTKKAAEVMRKTDFNFVTVWETKTTKTTSFGFNFECKPVGFSVTESNGVVRTVVQVIEK